LSFKRILRGWKIVCHSLSLLTIIACVQLLIFLLFEIIYGFNSLTPLDFILLPIDERVSINGNKKSQMVKALYKSVWQHIKKKNGQYASKANKGQKQVVFQPGDWV